MPAPDSSWIARLLEMQHGTNGLRELKIKVLPGPWLTLANPPNGFLTNVDQFDLLLQTMIKKGAEKHGHVEQDISLRRSNP